MDIRQLEAFVYTIQYHSFSEAAKKLYLSQPTVSAHIRSLEKELRTPLIIRTTKQLTVTSAGERLYDYASSILNLRQKAIEELSGQQEQNLHIGASSVPSLYILPDLICSFHREKPDICFHTCASDSLDIIQKVSEQTLDIGFVGTINQDPDCVFLPFTTDELVIAAPASPYYQNLFQSDLSLRQFLITEPFLLRESASGTRQEMERFLEKLGISAENLNIIACMNDPDALKQCIIQGLGISILSRKAVEVSARKGELLMYPVKGHNFIRSLYLVRSRKGRLGGVADEFIRFTRRYYGV